MTIAVTMSSCSAYSHYIANKYRKTAFQYKNNRFIRIYVTGMHIPALPPVPRGESYLDYLILYMRGNMFANYATMYNSVVVGTFQLHKDTLALSPSFKYKYPEDTLYIEEFTDTNIDSIPMIDYMPKILLIKNNGEILVDSTNYRPLFLVSDGVVATPYYHPIKYSLLK